MTPMDFELSETQALIEHAARDYTTGMLAPAAAELDRTERFGEK